MTANKEEKAPALDLSTQLLMKIADELSSIRTELSSLKEEFKTPRQMAPDADAVPQHEPAHGFFEEEDDEKISLTGDELDNILNTAHFTEEAGADAGDGFVDDFNFDFDDESLAASFAKTPKEDLASKPDILTDGGPDETPAPEAAEDEAPQDGLGLGGDDDENNDSDHFAVTDDMLGDFDMDIEEDASAGEPAPDTDAGLDLPDNIDMDDAEDIIGDDTDDLRKLREEGAAVMTSPPAPEDEEFLVQGASDTPFDETGIDLPEPEAGSAEPPPEEPAPDTSALDGIAEDDISIDLDMEDEQTENALDDEFFGAGPSEAPAEEQDELSIPMYDETADKPEPETQEEEAADQIPEGFVVGDDNARIVPDSDEIAGTDDTATDDDTFADIDMNDTAEEETAPDASVADLPSGLRQELKSVLSYMDQLLESLPDDKIEEFAQSNYFDTYKKLFKELGLS